MRIEVNDEAARLRHTQPQLMSARSPKLSRSNCIHETPESARCPDCGDCIICCRCSPGEG